MSPLRDEFERHRLDPASFMIELTGDARIIAEGIESHAQLAALVQAGVQYGQGFLLGAAMPARELEPLLGDRLRSCADAGDRAAPC